MAHEHSHGEAESTYFTDQILTIILTALLGGVAIMMWKTDMLGRMLIKEFWWMVLTAGIALIILAVIRAIAIWKLAGQKALGAESLPDENKHSHGHEHSHAHDEKCEHSGHEHSHVHEEKCQHEHANEHGHAHSHSHAHAHAHSDEKNGEPELHDHGWAPWKYAILIVPVVLYALNLPNESYSEDRLKKNMNSSALVDQRALLAQVVGTPALMVWKNTGRFEKKFSDLANGAASSEKRQAWEGQTIVLRGQFRLVGDRDFTLFRVKMNCCSADQVVLNARIISPDALQGLKFGDGKELKFGDWIQVEGELEFMKVEGKGDWVPVVRLQSVSDIKQIEPDYNSGDA